MTQRAWDDWEVLWDSRVAAMETVLGEADTVISTSMIPFHLGSEFGGAADVVHFRKHVAGVVSVTSDLIGCDEQIENDLGTYELMICERDESDWGTRLISRLANYTLEAELNPGETMDIGTETPVGSTIEGLLFLEYARFLVLGRRAGLLLCIGITEDEHEACMKGRRDEVEVALKKRGVFPYTDLFRESVLI